MWYMVEYKQKKTTILKSIIRYVIGVVFLLTAVSSLFSGDILVAVFSLLIGVILTPATADPIENKYKMSVSGPVRVIAVFCLLIAMGATADPVEPTENVISDPIASDTLKVNNSTVESVAPETQKVKADTPKVKADSPEPTDTKTPVAEPTPIDNNGKLDILTNPEGATITVDGVSKGLSPIEGLSIDAGTHSVTAYLSGYDSQKEKVEIKNSETKKLFYALVPETSTSNAEEESPEPVETEAPKEKTSSTDYQDLQWITVMSRNAQILGNDMSNVGEAATNLDYVSLSGYGSTLYDDSVAAIDDSNTYDVSPALQPTKDEFEKAMDDSKDAGSNTVSAMDELDQGRTDEAIKYLTLTNDNIEACKRHVETATSLLNEYNSKL